MTVPALPPLPPTLIPFIEAFEGAAYRFGASNTEQPNEEAVEAEVARTHERDLLKLAIREALAAVRRQTLDDVWYAEFVDPRVNLCTLCANTGTLTTTATSAAGVLVEYRGPCICPNGRALASRPQERTP